MDGSREVAQASMLSFGVAHRLLGDGFDTPAMERPAERSAGWECSTIVCVKLRVFSGRRAMKRSGAKQKRFARVVRTRGWLGHCYKLVGTADVSCCD